MDIDSDGYPVNHSQWKWKEYVPAANEWCEEMGASVMEEIMEDLDGFAEALQPLPCWFWYHWHPQNVRPWGCQQRRQKPWRSFRPRLWLVTWKRFSCFTEWLKLFGSVHFEHVWLQGADEWLCRTCSSVESMCPSFPPDFLLVKESQSSTPAL